MLDAKQTKTRLVGWLKSYFAENATPETKAVIGISGGKDSSVCATLLVETLGKERVLGVHMPNGEQPDIDVSRKLCDFLEIEYIEINIEEAVKGLYSAIPMSEFSDITTFNTPARIRMTTLYAVSGSIAGGGRVANTCNLSEDWVGYATKFGDSAGDFSPLSHLTVTEVKAIGYELGLPREFIEKTPIDGLCGKSDEDNLGFTYAELDRYIREGICENPQTLSKIEKLHDYSLHKLRPMPSFNPDFHVKGDWRV